MHRHEETVKKGQVMRTETGRDRSDMKPNKETLMGKEMKRTGISRQVSGGKAGSFESGK